MNDPPGSSLAPLSLPRFTRYFLVPFVASHLIRQDLKCDARLAYQLMVASCSVGDVLHPYEEEQPDDELEEVLRDINVKGRALRASIPTPAAIMKKEVPAQGPPTTSSLHPSLARGPSPSTSTPAAVQKLPQLQYSSQRRSSRLRLHQAAPQQESQPENE